MLSVSHTKITSKTNVYSFSRMFSSISFIVSDLAFKSLINSEFCFLCGIREGSYFNLLHVEVKLNHDHLKAVMSDKPEGKALE